MMDIISCFGEIAEENGWKITKHSDCLYTVESTFTSLEPYRFDVDDGGQPVTCGAFVDIVNAEVEDLDVSKQTYLRLNSDGHYKADNSCGIGAVYDAMSLIRTRLYNFYIALADRYAQIEKDIQFYNEPHTDAEKCSHALESVLNDERLSEGEIVDMMYCLVRNIAEYAVSHNNSNKNHIARELLGGIFSEEVLGFFDKPQLNPDDESKPLVKTVSEFCPHCETEIEMMWNVSSNGYKAFCPVCGQRLMLCDECMHSIPEGECIGKCDYCSEDDTCQHNQPKKAERRSSNGTGNRI